MGAKTNIAWTDATWTIVTGCAKVSAGCKYCYADREWGRFAANPRVPKYFGRAFTDVKFHSEALDLPLRWASKPRMVFVPSMGDLFHESITDREVAAVFGMMAATPHTYQVLTKRAERMRDFMRRAEACAFGEWTEALESFGFGKAAARLVDAKWPPANVWLGVSVEDQEQANRRIPALLETPAAVRFLSAEPLIGPLSLTQVQASPTVVLDVLAGCGTDSRTMAQSVPSTICNRLDWVIVGGESGSAAVRPMHPDWVRRLRDDCGLSGTPFFFKQWGAWAPPDMLQGNTISRQCASVGSDGVLAESDGCGGEALMAYVGRSRVPNLLDGQVHEQFPGAE